MRGKCASSLAIAAALAVAPAHAGAGAPAFDPGNFARSVTNPWFPLTAGTIWRYRGQKDGKAGTEVMTATHKSKTILGVHATVVHDRLFLDKGGLAEDTLDWYAQDRQGNVWYFGEATKELNHGRVVSREGSWIAGVNHARAGIFMPAHPRVGESHRQEYWKGHAEDHFTIASVRADTLTTKEWTPLEPGVRDRKVYERGTGEASEATLKGGSEGFALVSVSRPRR